jgi:hypothetical protein
MTVVRGRRALDVYLLMAFLLGVLVAQHRLNNGITSDGALYFAHLRSIVFDRDLDIASELDVLRQPPRPHHVVPIGPAIAWAPAYLAVAAADWLGGITGRSSPDAGASRGLTGAYVQAVMLSSLVVMAAGVVVLHLRLRREFEPSIALVTSILIVAATPLIWYVVFEPSMTHAVSFGVVAIALVLTERWLIEAPPTRRHALLLGAWFSLVMVVRPEDGAFAVFPLAALLFAAACRALSLGERARLAGAMILGAAPLLALQAGALVWLLSANRFTLAGGDEGYLNVLDSRWADVLFSSRHGLLSWTPVVWIALVGTVAHVRRRPLWAVPALVAFAVLVWTNGSAHDWAGGWAFGGRRFTSVLAAFAPGMAMAVLAAYRRPLVVIAPVAAAIVGWNVLLMTQYQQQLLPRDEAVRFDVMVRQQADLITRPPFFYPFAFPANVWFAWREGLPVDRYDLLGSEPLRREMYLPLNDWGERFLLDGWQNAGGDAFGSSHLLAASSGTILVPLDVPDDVAFAVDLEARADGEPRGVATRLDLAVNARSFGDLPLEVGAPKPSRRAFVAPAGAKIWRRGYNRVTITRPPDAAPTTRFIVYALRVGASPGGGRVP